jgi:hypothetical protein
MQPDQLLVACTKCRAWPMSVHAGKMRWIGAAPMVRFTCAKCGYREERLSGALYERSEDSTPLINSGLWSGMELIQVMLVCRFRHKSPCALVKSGVSNQRGTAPRVALTRSFLREGHFRRVAGASKSSRLIVRPSFSSPHSWSSSFRQLSVRLRV